MKSFFLLLVLLTFSLQLLANESTDLVWQKELVSQNIEIKNQAYCYSNNQKRIEGINTKEKMRLASLTKIVTSLWAMEKLGARYQYETKIYIKGDHAFLAGSHDPLIDEEKIFYLLTQLNNQGFFHFSSITFDSSFIFYPEGQTPQNEFPILTKDSIKMNLMNYLNSSKWNDLTKDHLKKWAGLSENKNIRNDIHFSADEVISDSHNPFLFDPAVVVYTLTSPPLFRYLKEMNIQSNNYIAQNLFLSLGGEMALKNDLHFLYGFTDDDIHLWTGSGLPLLQAGIRFDNYASCETLLSLMDYLNEEASREGLDLVDIMPVPGIDQGTFSNRPYPETYTNAMIAKSGTLFHTSTLAGILKTKTGYHYFGFLNQTTDIEHSRSIQDKMIKTLMEEFSGPTYFKYKSKQFYSYLTETFLLR